MNRRDFLASAAIACALPVASHAQSKMPTIGVLSTDPVKPSLWMQLLIEGLREKGYVAGRNVTIDDRSVARSGDLPQQAARLARANVDVIAALGSTAILAAAKATTTIPIIMVGGIDAVAAGFAKSLSRPAGNVSGVNLFASELQGKRLELLKETIPSLKRIGVLGDAGGADNANRLAEAASAARALKLDVRVVSVRDAEKLNEAFAELSRTNVEAVVMLNSRILLESSVRLAQLARQRRLPAISPAQEFVEAGGLLSYGVSYRAAFVNAASYIDRILKGAKPGDLPIEQPRKFDLAVNLQTAKALGVNVPQSVLLRADKVIE